MDPHAKEDIEQMKVNRTVLLNLILILVVCLGLNSGTQAADDFTASYSTIVHPGASLATGSFVEWDFNADGKTDSSTLDSSYAFPTPGTYQIKMKSTSATGINTVSKTITITEQVNVASTTSTKDWLNAAWKYRIKVTVQPTQIKAALTEFPLYLDLSILPATFFSNVKADGSDIRVTKSDSKTEVPIELVSINSTSKTGELYFKAPTLSSTENAFYIYYGNSAATAYAASSTLGRNNVWNNYAAVYHMQQDPSSSAPQLIDSTGHSLNGTSEGSMTSSDLVAGKLSGKAIDFDGSNDRIALFSTSNSTYGPSGKNKYTFSSWVKPISAGAADGIFGAYAGGSGQSGGGLGLQTTNTSSTNAGFFIGANQGGNATDNSLTDSTWHHLVGVFDGTLTGDANRLKLYQNGTQKTLTFNSGYYIEATIPAITQTIYIGDITTLSRYWTGLIDEMRFYAGALSSEWIQTEYNNQNSNASFYSLSAEELY